MRLAVCTSWPSIWCSTISGFTTRPASSAPYRCRMRTAAGLHVHFDIGDGAAIGDQVRAQADAAAAAQAPLAESRPATRGASQFARRGRGIEHAAPARVLDIAAAEFQRIDVPAVTASWSMACSDTKAKDEVQRRAQPGRAQVVAAPGSRWLTSFTLAMSYMPPQTSGLTPCTATGGHSAGGRGAGQLRGGFHLAPVVLPAVILVGDDAGRRHRPRRAPRPHAAGRRCPSRVRRQRMNCRRTGAPASCESSAAACAASS